MGRVGGYINFLGSTCYLDYWRYLHVSAAAAETGEISLVPSGARDIIYFNIDVHFAMAP